MSSLSDPPGGRILQAALHLFAQYGFQRTSMADIARQAGMARATLYLRFRDKRAIIEALAAALVEDSLEAARAAWQPGAALADNLAATLLAKDLPLYRLLKASPHGAELLAVDAALTSAHVARLQSGFRALLEARAVAIGGDFSVFGGPAGFADYVAITSGGLKHEASSELQYVEAVARLASVTAAALGK